MEAIKQVFDDLPEQVIINIPKNFVHRKAEIIIITEGSTTETKKNLLAFFGLIPDFPDRAPQGIYEIRENL
jgi:hypothetical protein